MRENLIKSDAEFNRILKNMRGVDFSGNKESVDKRYAYLENMYRDYSAGGGDLIESVPGFRMIHSGVQINGIHLQITQDGKRYLIINDGGELYRCSADKLDVPTRLGDDTLLDLDKKSYAFNFGGRLYVSDTYNFHAIEADGSISQVTDDAESAPYVPTVYMNGAEYEQRNLLSAMFYEKHYMETVANYTRGTSTLLFRIIDEKNRLCSVSGILDNPDVVHIPAQILLGDQKYSVVRVEMEAFSNKNRIRIVRIADSITTIGASAFYGCISLEMVLGGAGLTEIRRRAFANTPLESIYLSGAIKLIGDDAIPSEAVVEYELDMDSYKAVEGAPKENVLYGVVKDSLDIEIKIRSKVTSIDSVTLDGREISYNVMRDQDNFITGVWISYVDKSVWTGSTLSILCHADTLAEQPDGVGKSFIERTTKANKDFTRTLKRCSRSTVIDDRVFLWGNPDYPSVIFYSNREDGAAKGLYFGALNYIDEGVGAEVLSVLGFSGGVLVFSRGGNDGECIRLYTPEESTNDPNRVIFKISEAHRGNLPLGAAINHGNEALYVTKNGLSEIGERSLYRSGSIEVRSTAVTAMLARENLSKATLCHWCGYVVLSLDGRMYLADTRATANFGGGKEYEWFFLQGVGTYRNDSRVYRYATMAHHDYIVSDTPDAIVKEEVWSEGTDSGTVFFVNSEEGKIEVYPTEEYSGGDFYPAEITLGFDDRLIFSTGCGDVCVFNNDMRGVAPARIVADPDFDPVEYEKAMGKRIHPDFYAFYNHSPRYALVCAYDDCGVPHLKKSTVKRSLAVKLAILGGGRILCEVGCDGGGYHPVGSVDGVSDFSTLSFATSPFGDAGRLTVALPERERGWVEKSIALYSEDFRSPFGVYSIGYRYRISGRIKNS